jgi:Leucine-rich repeat (LRR) protein
LGNLEILRVNSYDSEKRSPFATLPETASKLASLRILNFCNSELTSLSDFLADLPALEKINIDGCDVNTIPPALQRRVDKGELTIERTESESDE